MMKEIHVRNSVVLLNRIRELSEFFLVEFIATSELKTTVYISDVYEINV